MINMNNVDGDRLNKEIINNLKHDPLIKKINKLILSAKKRNEFFISDFLSLEEIKVKNIRIKITEFYRDKNFNVNIDLYNKHSYISEINWCKH